MSGGAWGYLKYKIEEESARNQVIVNVIAQIEHEMDWGISCDTCYNCAKLRVIAALEELFENGCSDDEPPIRILTSSDAKYKCDKCKARL